MKNSPALLILIAISLEIAFFGFGFGFVKNPFILIAIPIIAVSLACFLSRSEAKNTLFVMLTIIFLTLLCSLRIAAALLSPPTDTGRADLSGVVTMADGFGRIQALIVRSDEGDFLIKRPKSEIYKLGEPLSLKGWIKPFASPKNSTETGKNSGFDEGIFWKSKGVTAEIAVTDIRRENYGGLNLHSFRQFIHDKFSAMPKTLGGYLDAMWTGLRDKELDARHRIWGTSHLLAVSGFHVGLIAGIAEFIFYFLRFRVRARGLVLSFFMWVYILISGAAPSAVRAACMFQAGILSAVLGRRVHAVNSVAVAAVLMLLYSPFLFWNVGWRLSVIAVLTITAISEILLGKRLKLWAWALIPPSVYLTTYPVVSSVFESVPLVGIVLNFIAVPFFAFAFPFISVAALSGADILQNITDAALRLYGDIADFLAWLLPWNIPYNTFFSALCQLFFCWLIVSAVKGNGTMKRGKEIK